MNLRVLCISSVLLMLSIAGCGGKKGDPGAPTAEIQGSLDLLGAQGASTPSATVKRGTLASAEGWSLVNGDHAPATVALEIDGARSGETSSFFPREDVSAALQRKLGPTGWAITFATDKLSVGTHKARIVVLGRVGESFQPLTVEFAARAPSTTTTLEVTF